MQIYKNYMTTTIIFCYNLICILKQNFISCLRNKLLFPDLARFILLLIAIAGLSGPISARTVRSGTPQVYRSYRPARVTIAVEDKETKDPLIGATIAIMSGRRHA